MEHSTPELILYVREQLAAGYTRSALETTLAQAGWSTDAIEETFRLLVTAHKTASPSEPAQQPIETAPQGMSSPATVSNQLDQLLTGENDQPLAMADISIESPVQDFAIETAIQDDILQTNQSESIVSDTMPVDPIQESFKNVDAQPVGPDPTQGQNNQTVPPTLQRDTDPSVRFTQGQNISIEENPEATIVSSTIIKKAHNWLYVIILVILVATTVGLLLLILHALNVYDALSIDTPVWADGILLWIQGLFGR